MGASRSPPHSTPKNGLRWVQCRVQVRNAVPNKKSSQPLDSDWPVDSRGGTRTRDPGIMSAVL
jgi:hypothetical protein